MKRFVSRFQFGLSRFDLVAITTGIILLVATAGLAILRNVDLRGPMVAYLYPIRNQAQNIWLAPVDNPSAAHAVTHSQAGIYNFDISPDGRFIAYSERQGETSASNEIMLLDLRTGQATQITRCAREDADCRTPVFNITGDSIAYERMTVNRLLDNVGPGAIRIWVADIRRAPFVSRPLFDDNQIIGHSPIWSQDGRAIAFYNSDIANPGILVYNFGSDSGDRSVKSISSGYGTPGALSPNGRQLIFPELIQREGAVYSYLRIADLDALTYSDLLDSQEQTDDTAATWHPDGQRAVIQRRYTDDRYTRGYQLYLVDVAQKSVEPLVVDARYNHGFFSFNRTGDQLIMQRFPLTNDRGDALPDATPEVWVLDMTTRNLTRISSDAFFPRWATP